MFIVGPNAIQYSENRIEQMWQMVKLVRETKDVPLNWKLTEPFLQAVQDFLGLKNRIEVLNTSFLDASIDGTQYADTLIGYYAHYDFSIFLPHSTGGA